ncbi:MAG: putative bifunctional diguanylate cyclase/phosphodiesterase [Mycobacterium leprae]
MTPHSTILPKGRLDWGAALVLANTLFVAWAMLWGFLHSSGSTGHEVAAVTVWFVLEFSIIALALRNMVSPSLTMPARRAWGLIGVAIVVLGVGSVLMVRESVAGHTGALLWSDVADLASAGLTLAGALALPGTRGTREERILLLIDSLIVSSTGTVLAWHFAVGRALPERGVALPGLLVALLFVMTDLALITATASAFVRSSGRARRSALLLALSALTITIGNLTWRYLILHGGYHPGGWPDQFWMLSALCLLYAANTQFHAGEGAEPASATGKAERFRPFMTWAATLAGSAIPPFLFSLPNHMRGSALNETLLLALDALITALIGFRYLLVAHYNARLLTANAARQYEARFHALVQNSKDLITLVAPDGTVIYQSPSHERVFGFKTSTVGRTIGGFVHPDDRRNLHEALENAARMPHGSTLRGKWRIYRVDGTWRQTETIVTNLLDQPEINAILLNTRDVTEHVQMEEQLRHQAYYDSLTGLANRALFMESLGQILAQPAETPTAVLMMDLDNFKTINDSLGHTAGDQLLMAVGNRLRDCLSGVGMAARLGGDEFAILLPVAGPDAAEAVSGELLGAFSSPFQVGEREIAITPSIGLVASAESMTNPEEVIRCADVAMYRAKRQGKGTYVLYQPGMGEVPAEQLELNIALRQALARSEFTLYYQPIYAVETGRIRGFEALLRWQHPTRGLVAPAEFIPVAEESDLIVEIGGWTLEEACRQARAWEEIVGPALAPVVNVNLSARQFQRGELMAEIDQALSQAGLSPDKLQVEITETAIMADVEAAATILERLKSTGIQVAVDDFGTGYASLSYLKRLPLDVIKVDRSFIDDLGHNQVDTAIVELIIGLSRQTGLAVTAEGVETAEQFELLRRMGAHRAQGFYLSRPLPADAAERLLREHFANELMGRVQ